MKFNGSEKQNRWAAQILQDSNLNETQIDNLLRYAGPTMHGQGIMDVTIVIEHRDDLSSYADSLGRFYQLSQVEKKAVAEEAAGMVRQIAKRGI